MFRFIWKQFRSIVFNFVQSTNKFFSSFAHDFETLKEFLSSTCFVMSTTKRDLLSHCHSVVTKWNPISRVSSLLSAFCTLLSETTFDWTCRVYICLISTKKLEQRHLCQILVLFKWKKHEKLSNSNSQLIGVEIKNFTHFTKSLQHSSNIHPHLCITLRLCSAHSLHLHTTNYFPMESKETSNSATLCGVVAKARLGSRKFWTKTWKIFYSKFK